MSRPDTPAADATTPRTPTPAGCETPGAARGHPSRLGHDFALKQDGHSRTRLIAGSVDARRVDEVSNDGYISTGGIVQVRKVDPLKGILSLTDRQRGAAVSRGLRVCGAGGTEDGRISRARRRRMSATVSARLHDDHAAPHDARDAMVYPDIVSWNVDQ